MKIFLTLLSFIILSYTPVLATDLSNEQAEKKKEGWYFVPIPWIGFSTENDVDFGVYTQIFENGSKDDPLFRITDHLLCISINTGYAPFGRDFFTFSVITNRFMGSKFNFGINGDISRNKNIRYYGAGGSLKLDEDFNNLWRPEVDNTTKDPVPSDTNPYGFNGYQIKVVKVKDDAELERWKDSMDHQYDKWNYYHDDYKSLGFSFGSEHLKPVYWELGTNFSRRNIYSFQGEEAIEAIGAKKYRSFKPTMLDVIRPIGYEGGWSNGFKLSIKYSTTDYGPYPTRGFFASASSSLNTKFLGSDYSNWGAGWSAGGYIPACKQKLILALRLNYDWKDETKNGEIPFYELPSIGLSGYSGARFLAKSAIKEQGELRWDMAEFVVSNQRFNLILSPFIEFGNTYGRAFDFITKPDMETYNMGYGASFLIMVNMDTSLRVTAESSTGGGFYLYMNFGNRF